MSARKSKKTLLAENDTLLSHPFSKYNMVEYIYQLLKHFAHYSVRHLMNEWDPNDTPFPTL